MAGDLAKRDAGRFAVEPVNHGRATRQHRREENERGNEFFRFRGHGEQAVRFVDGNQVIVFKQHGQNGFLTDGRVVDRDVITGLNREIVLRNRNAIHLDLAVSEQLLYPRSAHGSESREQVG